MMTVDFRKPRGSRDVFPPARQRPPTWEAVPAPAQSLAYQLQQARVVAHNVALQEANGVWQCEPLRWGGGQSAFTPVQGLNLR